MINVEFKGSGVSVEGYQGIRISGSRISGEQDIR